MTKIFNLLAILFLPICLFAQAPNTNLLGSWDGAPDDYNDVWGYVDGAGNEYAIVGSKSKIWVVNVTGSTPTLVGSITGGTSSIWRDMKVYGTYAYGVADQGSEGLTVIDLSNLPTSISLVGQYNTDFTRAHNIFIDTNSGRLYVAGSSGGSNSANSGLIVYNLAANPANPPRMVSQSLSGNGGYVHDVYVKNDTAYCSHGYNGFYVHDFTNTSAVTTIGGMTSYPQSGYNHSGWLTSDGLWYVVVDEVPTGKACKIADVSDLSAITVPTSNVFQNCLIAGNTGCTPHNPFVLGNYAYMSYYEDGLVIFDITNPAAVTRAGYYDTYTAASNTSSYNGYEGAWGCYPYLPSGKILVSDISNGLKVVEFAPNLPVEQTRFRGTHNKDGSVTLKWETYSELNNDFFEIEKSANGIDWFSLTKLEGRGNANGIHYYTAKDAKPIEPMTFYRLKQVDFDGTFAYSKMISVETGEETRIKASPTVFGAARDFVKITLPETQMPVTYDLRLFDAAGRQVRTISMDSDYSESYQVPVADLPKGTYVLHVSSSAFSQNVRIVKH